MKLAQDHEVKTIAFPNLSTGVYGYPKDKAAQVAVETVHSFLEKNQLPEKVIFMVDDDENLRLYEKLLKV